jgi:putative ABC transport system permease protein
VLDVFLQVKYDDPANKQLVQDEIEELLRIRRHVKVADPDNFEIFGPESLSRLWDQVTWGLRLFMLAVSSVGLMVGGVGVMNIMLVSVTERTREIGIRKALGARRRDIMVQFLVESATMSLCGGMIGVIGGITVAKIITLLVSFPSEVQIWSVLVGLLVATSVGIFFGVYPARKAAQLDPIAALRSEL